MLVIFLSEPCNLLLKYKYLLFKIEYLCRLFAYSILRYAVFDEISPCCEAERTQSLKEVDASR